MALPLEDIELIRQLKYAYCRCIDTANIAELRTLFTEDAA
ncbi:UNVERIFIED_CONTAM: nuclear transport factor 2 family protein, partial [Salmonella enterica subsp. enterica serovar Weltevreden]